MSLPYLSLYMLFMDYAEPLMNFWLLLLWGWLCFYLNYDDIKVLNENSALSLPILCPIIIDTEKQFIIVLLHNEHKAAIFSFSYFNFILLIFKWKII